MYRYSKLLSVLVAFSILAAIGCAAKKSLWGDVKTGLILQYRLPEKETLKYRIANQINQNLEMMGQSVATQINMGYVFSCKAKASKNDAQQLGITIDSMKVAVKTPQGDFSPDVTSVVGKSFEMTLSALGKDLELSGAEAIKYTMGPGSERSIVSDFKAFFPDMAGKPVKIRDTWTTRDTLDIKDSNSHLQMLFENLNTLQGLEVMNGLECVKVTAAVKGTMSGTGKQGGADLSFTGDIGAMDTWYFAYKEGILVKTTSDGSTKSTITVSGPQNMTIPMTMTTKMATTLIKP